jgi:hypothetical protein
MDIISNTSFKNDISPRGILSVLNLIGDLIDKKNDCKILFRKVVREHYLKMIINYLRPKQFLAILEWPGYKREEGAYIAQNILIAVLRIL